MQMISLSTFEGIMKQQNGKILTFVHYGSLIHSKIYENFKFENCFSKYRFVELDENEDLLSNSIYKNNITYVNYLDFSNQIEIGLNDLNRIVIDLSDSFEIQSNKSFRDRFSVMN